MLEASSIGFDELQAKVASLELALDSVSILDEAAALLLNRIRERYLAETDPEGVPWVPSAAGIARRMLGGPGTLFDTGTLFHSIQAHAVDDETRSISTDVPYGVYHQNGEGQEKRVFLGFGQDDLGVVEKLLLRRIAEVGL